MYLFLFNGKCILTTKYKEIETGYVLTEHIEIKRKNIYSVDELKSFSIILKNIKLQELEYFIPKKVMHEQTYIHCL